MRVPTICTVPVFLRLRLRIARVLDVLDRLLLDFLGILPLLLLELELRPLFGLKLLCSALFLFLFCRGAAHCGQARWRKGKYVQSVLESEMVMMHNAQILCVCRARN